MQLLISIGVIVLLVVIFKVFRELTGSFIVGVIMAGVGFAIMYFIGLAIRLGYGKYMLIAAVAIAVLIVLAVVVKMMKKPLEKVDAQSDNVKALKAFYHGNLNDSQELLDFLRADCPGVDKADKQRAKYLLYQYGWKKYELPAFGTGYALILVDGNDEEKEESRSIVRDVAYTEDAAAMADSIELCWKAGLYDYDLEYALKLKGLNEEEKNLVAPMVEKLEHSYEPEEPLEVYCRFRNFQHYNSLIRENKPKLIDISDGIYSKTMADAVLSNGENSWPYLELILKAYELFGEGQELEFGDKSYKKFGNNGKLTFEEYKHALNSGSLEEKCVGDLFLEYYLKADNALTALREALEKDSTLISIVDGSRNSFQMLGVRFHGLDGLCKKEEAILRDAEEVYRTNSNNVMKAFYHGSLDDPQELRDFLRADCPGVEEEDKQQAKLLLYEYGWEKFGTREFGRRYAFALAKGVDEEKEKGLGIARKLAATGDAAAMVDVIVFCLEAGFFDYDLEYVLKLKDLGEGDKRRVASLIRQLEHSCKVEASLEVYCRVRNYLHYKLLVREFAESVKHFEHSAVLTEEQRLSDWEEMLRILELYIKAYKALGEGPALKFGDKYYKKFGVNGATFEEYKHALDSKSLEEQCVGDSFLLIYNIAESGGIDRVQKVFTYPGRRRLEIIQDKWSRIQKVKEEVLRDAEEMYRTSSNVVLKAFYHGNLNDSQELLNFLRNECPGVDETEKHQAKLLLYKHGWEKFRTPEFGTGYISALAQGSDEEKELGIGTAKEIADTGDAVAMVAVIDICWKAGLYDYDLECAEKLKDLDEESKNLVAPMIEKLEQSYEPEEPLEVYCRVRNYEHCHSLIETYDFAFETSDQNDSESADDVALTNWEKTVPYMELIVKAYKLLGEGPALKFGDKYYNKFGNNGPLSLEEYKRAVLENNLGQHCTGDYFLQRFSALDLPFNLLESTIEFLAPTEKSRCEKLRERWDRILDMEKVVFRDATHVYKGKLSPSDQEILAGTRRLWHESRIS